MVIGSLLAFQRRNKSRIEAPPIGFGADWPLRKCHREHLVRIALTEKAQPIGCLAGAVSSRDRIDHLAASHGVRRCDLPDYDSISRSGDQRGTKPKLDKATRRIEVRELCRGIPCPVMNLHAMSVKAPCDCLDAKLNVQAIAWAKPGARRRDNVAPAHFASGDSH